MITVQMKGVERVSRMTVNLGPELNKMINKTGGEFLRSVQRGAKIRAPRQTGALIQSIKVRKGRKKGNWILSVDSPYGRFVEQGYRPHLVSSSAGTRAGGTIASVYGIPKGVTLLVRGPRKKFFVRDSFQAAIPRLPGMLSKSVKQAIDKSRR